MSERDPFALLLHDDFMGEFVDSGREGETFQTIEDAHWGAAVLLNELQKGDKDLGTEHESFPYKVYLVGPDGSRSRFWD